MTILQLESAVKKLPSRDLKKFSRWFEEFIARVWDEQIESDVKSGKLDRLGKQADKAFDAGKCTAL